MPHRTLPQVVALIAYDRSRIMKQVFNIGARLFLALMVAANARRSLYDLG